MAERLRKIGVFVAGGPAAGINGVVKGIVQEADNAGIPVVGYLDGAHGLVHNRLVHLTRQMVEDVHILGGSLLGTSRYRIDEERGELRRLVANLAAEGVEALVSIGGEGTLQLAERLRQAEVPIVHVPKTIDNDIAGVEQTFGFDTAVFEASRMLTAIKLDAEASGLWFVVEIMGRYTGHLALEAGLAAGCTRVLIPEEGAIRVEELASLVDSRARCGRDWGVILAAESASFGQGYITRYGRLGGVADQVAAGLERGCKEAGVECRLRTSNLGYFLRCAAPTGFDRSYAAKLGLGAARFIMDPARSGQMVTIVDDQLVGVPTEQVAGVRKPVELSGVRYQALRAVTDYESARADLVEQRRARSGAASALGWLRRHADAGTAESLAMRLGIPVETLLEVLQELQHRDAAPGAAPGGGNPP